MVRTPIVEIAQTGMPWYWQQHLPSLFFVFAFGACVGSFLNVVNYRIPAGMSILTPPSRCPTCGARLRFFRENLPIFGWFMVRGKCRYCGARISSEYMIVELLMALLFTGLYVLTYMTGSQTTGTWASQVMGDWWHYNEFVRTFPAFFVWAFLVAGLYSMTVIDARTFTIPLQVPVFVTMTAFVLYSLQALLPSVSKVATAWPISTADWQCFALSTGGMIGVVVGVLLLKFGKLRYSFADYHEYLPEEATQEQVDSTRVSLFELINGFPILTGITAFLFGGWVWGVSIALGTAAAVVVAVRIKDSTGAPVRDPKSEQILADDYPHARREMWTELKFLTPAMLGMMIGYGIGTLLPDAPPPVVLQVLGGSFAGYLMGGGLIWATRILATLVFGREAMGLGDVHLLAAVGAVLGWIAPIFVFFIAPFSGIAWVLLSMGLGAVLRKFKRELPYGPHLAIATIALVVFWPGLEKAWNVYMTGLPLPEPGLVQEQSP